MKTLNVSLIQQSIIEDWPEKNLIITQKKVESLKGKTDLVILPELFTTGFTLNNLELAETNDGVIISTLKNWASSFNLAITGSFLAKNESLYYNRGFFITPQGKTFFYDKKHLFPIGKEAKMITPGNAPLIISYNGWNIKLLVCYDLRFPIWSRNTNLAYDLLIYVANWPTLRRKAWETLLSARAIENQSYVIGVNRIGKDSNNLDHHGYSCIHSPEGDCLIAASLNKEEIINETLSLNEVRTIRKKYPFWKDNDSFKLE
ncbi:MAG: nitrilase family protein [Bacteroidales bacterium]|nr:nitrilase family protein [Bacteroidales bacterium]